MTLVETTRTLLRYVLRHETFAGGAVTTRWLEEAALAS
jgi:biotin carboxylase